MTVVIEAAVESLAAALAAARGGADRLELCANLDVGGTTPSAELFAAVKSRVDIPVFAMIRPRGGSFIYTAAERDAMRRDIALVRQYEADGIVLGLLDERSRIDTTAVRDVLGDAGDLPVTFHRAFDEIADRHSALDTLIELGIDRVLTSGGAPTALAGAESIRAFVEHGGDAIRIMAGGGVRAHNAGDLVRRTGVRELHARCELDPARISEMRQALESA
ncbi:MAG TPA: copper homeostasis protein CutC [Gemmatimonadaceae bacterium]|nr:copper homeostasis protein CutC [Gemmatimonadaceae bacterium]